MNDQFFTVDIFTPVQITEEEERAAKQPRRGALRVFLPSNVAHMAIAVAMTGVFQLATVPHGVVVRPVTEHHDVAQSRLGYVMDHQVGQGIANLLQFRLQSDDPADDDLISSKDLL